MLYKIKILLFSSALIFFLILLALLILRPARSPIEQQLDRGVIYRRAVIDLPRPNIIHTIVIDLKSAVIKFLVTPPEKKGGDVDIKARTTSEFLREFGLQIAINGSNFKPFYVDNPFYYYPQSGEPVNVLGRAISNGITYSQAASGWPVICFYEEGIIKIEEHDCIAPSTNAISGSLILLKDGSYTKTRSKDADENLVQPQSAIALDREGQKLTLIVVDGRQPWYSEGLSAIELSDYLKSEGAYNALLLDGGGSSTLVIEKDGASNVLNSPIHTYIPLRERPVANHLGVFLKWH